MMRRVSGWQRLGPSNAHGSLWSYRTSRVKDNVQWTATAAWSAWRRKPAHPRLPLPSNGISFCGLLTRPGAAGSRRLPSRPILASGVASTGALPVREPRVPFRPLVARHVATVQESEMKAGRKSGSPTIWDSLKIPGVLDLWTLRRRSQSRSSSAVGVRFQVSSSCTAEPCSPS